MSKAPDQILIVEFPDLTQWALSVPVIWWHLLDADKREMANKDSGATWDGQGDAPEATLVWLTHHIGRLTTWKRAKTYAIRIGKLDTLSYEDAWPLAPKAASLMSLGPE